MELKTRWAIKRDLPEILDIEKSSFLNPWEEKDFLNCFNSRDIIGKVIYDNESTIINPLEEPKILGFLIYRLKKISLEILNFTIHPNYIRMKIGTFFIKEMINRLTPQRRKFLHGIVRESNLSVQLFLKSVEFKAVKIYKNYYDDTEEDGYRMIYKTKIHKKPKRTHTNV